MSLFFKETHPSAQGVATNKQGYFSLGKSTYDATIIISFIGFTTQEIKTAGHTSIVIEMEKSPVNLQEIVITPQSAVASFHAICNIELNRQPICSAHLAKSSKVSSAL